MLVFASVGVTAGGSSSVAQSFDCTTNASDCAFNASVDCAFNASMVEDHGAATELTSSQHCGAATCRASLAASMARNYQEVWGRPFNGAIADFAIRCWCEVSCLVALNIQAG